MNVELLYYTPYPDIAIASAARVCYSAKDAKDVFEDMTEEKAEKLVKQLASQGHWSAFEHASFTFAIDGVSRALTHQLVRHRMASYNQKSQRYVKEEDFDYVTPKSVESCELGTGEIVYLPDSYSGGGGYGFDPMSIADHYKDIMEQISSLYKHMLEAGIPKEDARYILPNACTTSIVVTMNARELIHFFSLRCCNRAQWEIRELADKMVSLVKEVSPIVFSNVGPSCVTEGVCHEGKMGCGNPRQSDGPFV